MYYNISDIWGIKNILKFPEKSPLVVLLVFIGRQLKLEQDQKFLHTKPQNNLHLNFLYSNILTFLMLANIFFKDATTDFNIMIFCHKHEFQYCSSSKITFLDLHLQIS